MLGSGSNLQSYGSLNVKESLLKGTHFGTNSKCSVIETASSVVTIITGAGMLALPFAASCVGWVCLVLLFLVGSMFMYAYTLLAQSILYVQQNFYGEYEIVDYCVLGKLAFGKGGDKVVLVILFLELLLALVSFLINIGTNLHLLAGEITVIQGIFITALVSFILSCLDMKLLSKFTSTGNLLTGLTVISLLFSAWEINDSIDTTSVTKRNTYFDALGLPIAFGMICFCFGGHGAFPKIFSSMTDQNKYPHVISIASTIVFFIYVIILCVGYGTYGNHVEAVITENIGKDLNGGELRFGRTLRTMAAVGIMSNLQVTFPLIILALRDLLHTVLSIKHSQSTETMASLFILGLTIILALSLRNCFAFVCSLVGSFTTMINSIVLPFSFFHLLACKDPLRRPSREVYIIHAVMIILAVCAAIIGTTSSLCGIFTQTHSITSLEVNAICTILLPHRH